MRTFFIILFSLSFCISFSQKGKDTYNTKINKANTVIIKSGKVTIGQIIINQTLNTKLTLTSQSRTKDSSGQIRTEFIFKNPENLPTFNISLHFYFDSPCDTAFSITEGIVWGMMTSYKNDRTEYKLTIDQLSSNSLIKMTVLSHIPIFTKIEGIIPKKD